MIDYTETLTSDPTAEECYDDPFEGWSEYDLAVYDDRYAHDVWRSVWRLVWGLVEEEESSMEEIREAVRRLALADEARLKAALNLERLRPPRAPAAPAEEEGPRPYPFDDCTPEGMAVGPKALGPSVEPGFKPFDD